MIVAGQRLPILIATRPVDFRCGHQALALMVQTGLKLDPHSGVTVVFRSKRGDQLKILVWDGTGMVPLAICLQSAAGHGADLQGSGTGQRRLAQGAGRHNAVVTGTVRSAV